MTKVLFLNVTTHGHVNPSLGLVNELTSRGVEVVYFSSDEFKEKIEAAGAVYRSYQYDLSIFKNGFDGLIEHGADIFEDILEQVKDESFDYMIHSIAMPFSKQIAEYLKIPAVSMLAVFMGMDKFAADDQTGIASKFKTMNDRYLVEAAKISERWKVTMPTRFFDLLMNIESLNIVFTSEYFLPEKERSFFDETYVFVGVDPYHRLEDLAGFPIDRLQQAEKVLYVSFGTIFGVHAAPLYQAVFDAFKDSDYLVVMAADPEIIGTAELPQNFIVQSYVPQSTILTYADAAITHNGLNSMNDLILNEVPIVSLPMGADQPALAQRLVELDAAIRFDYQAVNPEELKQAVEEVQKNAKYKINLKKIKQTFLAAGGYRKAVDAIEKYADKA